MKLHYRKDTDFPWHRQKRGNGFTFVNEVGNTVDKKHRNRFLSLSIPPAWSEVAVSPDPLSHIQAVGNDTRGRRQYIYHPELVKHNQKQKFDQMLTFGERLPALREVVKEHMREHSLSRNRVLAAVVWLLEHTFIRVGNKVYADQNQSYGLTTMRNKHVEIEGDTITFSFMGKSGIFHELDVTHPRVAKTIKACIDLPGYELFQYLDPDSNRQIIDSEDVNSYLQTYAGSDFSAKDFRTWGGSVLAGASFYKIGKSDTAQEMKKNTSSVVGEVAKHLGNTKKVCRTYYIHPLIISSYEQGVLVPHFAYSYERSANRKLGLSPEEYATWSLIKDS
ncbi:MAG: DNA topoisomerase IB [bacterium]|nr:DNA topoisomerase IB [bacterium]